MKLSELASTRKEGMMAECGAKEGLPSPELLTGKGEVEGKVNGQPWGGKPPAPQGQPGSGLPVIPVA